jgi:pseudouridine synthase
LAKERLQKILSRAGISSRRKAEDFLREGRILVNGQVVRQLDFKADPSEDHIRVDGRLIKRLEPRVYYLLNKPKGVLCTRSDPEGRPVITDLLRTVRGRVYPLGRLDANSEGLLILTNDGDFFQLMAHPSHQKSRTYHVKVRGFPAEKQIQQLRKGVDLSDGRTQPAKIDLMEALKSNSWWRVVVKEGRNRLVRRMFERIHHPVLRLIRVKYGPLGLGELKPGQSRRLSREEVDLLLKSDTRSERTHIPRRWALSRSRSGRKKTIKRRSRQRTP